ncbi:MAG: hypothetical protein IKU13_04215, partial [Clostridia bacterium]|nr:hypothetical protein [Clostridia bacterium]
MKKILAITLTLAMLFTMTAMAEESKQKQVTASYNEGINSGTIYSIDITWGSLEYTYNAASTGTWDPETHTYKNVAEANWTCENGADTITVTNHSNAAVNVNVTYTTNDNYTSVIGTLDKSSFELATAEGTSFSAAPSNTAKLELSGTLSSDANNVTVGE